MDNFESYFSLAFLTVMTLNFLAAFGLVVTKRIRTWRRHGTESRTHKVLQGLKKEVGTGPDENLKYLREDLEKLRLSELRSVIQRLSKNEVNAHRSMIYLVASSPPRKQRLLHNLRSNKKWPKIDALIICGSVRMEEAFPDLKEALGNDDSDIAYASLTGLGEWDETPSMEILISLLNGNSSLNPSRVATYIEQGYSECCDLLLEKAANHDPVTRYWAVKLLKKYPRSQVQEAILSRVHDSDTNVRAAALETLGEIGSEDCHDAILHALEDSIWYVRSQAARSCGKLQINAAIPRLIQLFHDREWWVRYEAKEALERFGPKAMHSLVKTLSDKDQFSRNMATEALENMGVIEGLLWELKKENADSEEAIEILARMQFAGGSPYISNLVKEHSQSAYQTFEKYLGDLNVEFKEQN